MADQAVPAQDESIGQRLKRLRLEKGLSQRELAAPGVSYAYISRIEAGSRQPSVKALRRLAQKLGVTTEYLETGSQLDRTEALELRLANLELAVRLGDPSDAHAQLEAVLEEAVAAADKPLALRARVALAMLAKENGDFRLVVELLEAAVEDEPFDPLGRPELYAQLGYGYSASGKAERAVELFERCLAEVRSAGGEPSLEARYATVLSYALSDTGNLARAEQVVEEALERVHDTEDAYMRVRLYWSLARVAHAESKPALALANARKAIALLEMTEDTINLARAHVLAAGISIARSDPDDAGQHLDDAVQLFGPNPSREDAARLLTRRSQAATLRGDGETAVELARAAIETIGDAMPAERGTALYALGEGLALTGRHLPADDAFREAVSLLEGQRQWRETTLACRAWARMLRAAGREEQALDVLERASELGLRATPTEARADR
ncbi:MAG TPA: helix-turn-helix domain-containing protein [Gaiellaceae bacterium]|nr:helix-turn-helix domain-containing protein [Gaiellaceae bacterium]